MGLKKLHNLDVIDHGTAVVAGGRRGKEDRKQKWAPLQPEMEFSDISLTKDSFCSMLFAVPSTGGF